MHNASTAFLLYYFQLVLNYKASRKLSDYNTTQKHLNRKNTIFSLLDDAYIFYEINPFYRKQLKQLNLRECNENKKTFIGPMFPSKFSFDEILVHF